MDGRKYKSNFWIIAEAYFKQPVFDQNTPISFNPLKFSKDYRIGLLERCWQLDYEIETCRLQLENYWKEASFAST